MNLSFDTVIAGAGLAGASLAAMLSGGESVLVIDPGNDPSVDPGLDYGVYPAASNIEMGICSPLMSRRARPVWRMESAVKALNELRNLTSEVGLFSSEGLLKPARDNEQASEFRDASRRWPDHGHWIDVQDCSRRWPAVHAPYGVLHVVSGASVSIPSWVSCQLRYAVTRGAVHQKGMKLLSWSEPQRTSRRNEITVRVKAREGELRQIRAYRLILAVGADYLRFPELASLHLHPIKGQWVCITSPWSVGELMPVSGAVYIAPGKKGFVLGSTFEHDYRHLRSTSSAAEQIIQNATRMIPDLVSSSVLDTGAALRVTVPEIRLPMVGPLRPGSRVWIVSGLGSKGILMAPMLASSFQEYFTDPDSIPKEIRVRYKHK